MLPLALLAALPAPQDPPAAAPPFVEVGERALPGVRTTSGSAEKATILEVNGGGLLPADLDLDGNADLVVVDGSTLERARAGEPGFPPRVFLGDGEGGFRPGGEEWEMAGGRWGMGGAIGDADGDGRPDVLVTEWGPDRLFLNRGGRGLEETTEASGLEGERWGTSAAFLDYDRDGALDLVVVNYLAFRIDEIEPLGCTWKGLAVMCGPEGLTPVHDQLYRGRGDGTFEEVSARAGFRPARAGYGLGVTTLDHDLDGDTDVYVANDSTPNFLWRNAGDGTFREVGTWLGVALDPNGKEQAGMGIGVGDLNGDDVADLLVTNFSGESNALYLSLGGRRGWRDGIDLARVGGASLHQLGWGSPLVDVDLDGDLDAVVFQGHVYPQADEPGTDTRYAQEDVLYRNVGLRSEGAARGVPRFEVEPLSAHPPSVTRAAAVLDLDGDGWPDLVALDLDGPVRVLRNAAAGTPGRHWLVVRLEARGGNRFGLGALVTAEWEGGRRTEEIRTAGGYQAASLPEARFGLGAAERVERVLVRWPSGRESELRDVAADRVLVVPEPEEEDEPAEEDGEKEPR